MREVAAKADAHDPFVYVVTPNVDHVVRYWREPLWAPLYAHAWRVYCDSRVLQKLAMLSGLTMPLAVGSDLTAHLFAEALKPSEPIVIIGGDGAMVQTLIRKFGLKDVRWHEPPMGLREKPEAVAAAAAFIAANPARFHFIAVGSPQQELIARAAHERGDCRGVGLCIGASLLFLTGRVKRAPMWMQRLSLEWLFRLASEPGRLWRRYLVEGPAIFGIWLKWRAAQREASRAAISSRNSR